VRGDGGQGAGDSRGGGVGEADGDGIVKRCGCEGERAEREGVES
jgi:hypothetical protein